MSDSFQKSFGEAIVRQREALGVLQSQLAERVQIDQGTLSRIEAGKMRCDVVRGRLIARALHTTLAGLSALADTLDETKSPNAA